MDQTDRAGPTAAWWDDGTGRSEEEVALAQGVALLAAALIGLFRMIDAWIEAWPLPMSRARG